MNRNLIGFTRRDFLRTSLLASAGVGFPLLSNISMTNNIWGAALDSTNDRILIVLELGGGNDGLNTVAPYGDDAYHRARPQIGLQQNQILPLNDYIGLHQNLSGLKNLYDQGNLAVINGVGYPDPDRSHFRSMEIWRTASDSDKYEHYGWIGRYFDEIYSPKSDPLYGVAISSDFPDSFHCRDGLGVAFKRAAQFRWQEGNANDREELFRRLNKSGGGHYDDERDVLYFMRNVTSNIARSSDRVIDIANQRRRSVDYPRGNPLATDLNTVADLIVGGLPTRIYYVTFTGFDTHAAQPNTHQRLLQQFGDAVEAFHNDLERNNLSGRVLMVCFSEFGRRVAENASQGTDHGTAGPMFVMGKNIKPGLHGKYPSLDQLDSNGDLKHEVDFRAVYQTVLESWLQADAQKVLGRDFSNLGIVA